MSLPRCVRTPPVPAAPPMAAPIAAPLPPPAIAPMIAPMAVPVPILTTSRLVSSLPLTPPSSSTLPDAPVNHRAFKFRRLYHARLKAVALLAGLRREIRQKLYAHHGVPGDKDVA